MDGRADCRMDRQPHLIQQKEGNLLFCAAKFWHIWLRTRVLLLACFCCQVRQKEFLILDRVPNDPFFWLLFPRITASRGQETPDDAPSLKR